MLYSPILSILRIFPLIFWAILMSILHFFYHFILRKNFFLFYMYFFKGLVKIFGIKVSSAGSPLKKKALFISNHISYLDILILGSKLNALFVAKSEINSWPVINILCRLGRTIFVNRKKFLKVKSQMGQIEKSLEDGNNVVLFPEGTSSDGLKVLNFKSSLLGVVESKIKKDFYFQPVSIFYSKLDGMPVEIKFRPFFAWFGNMDLLSHAWKFLGLGISEVKIHFHKPRKFDAFRSRKDVSEYCHNTISNQISFNFQNVEVEKKIKLNEFKLL